MYLFRFKDKRGKALSIRKYIQIVFIYTTDCFLIMKLDQMVNLNSALSLTQY